VGALAATAGASAIKYQLKVPNATVHMGAQTYANFPVTFTFVADDSTAVTGLVLIGGNNILYSANFQGTASVDVNSGPGGSLATAVFAPNQIVVSVDHNNQGVEFGLVPSGIGPAGFDVTQLQPLYPAGVSVHAFFNGETVSNWYGYDLTLAYARNNTALSGAFHPDGSVDILAAVYVCDQFNGSIYFMSCAFPPDSIQTDQGAFTIDEIPEPTLVGSAYTLYIGEFTATPVGPVLVPFSAFTASADISRRQSGRFELRGRFTLGAGSNGINPVTEAVILQLGNFTAQIPSGSFKLTREMRYVYEGTIAGVALEVRISPIAPNSDAISVEGSGVNLAGMTSPITVGLTIGNDTGTTTAKVESGSD
jgi:hypothetical protein